MPPQYDNRLCKYIVIIDIADISRSTCIYTKVANVKESVQPRKEVTAQKWLQQVN